MDDPLHLTGKEIQRLVEEYPKSSIEHQAALDLIFYQQKELDEVEVVELEDVLRDEARFRAAEAQMRVIADLKADLKELATHVRTVDGIEFVYRLKLKGSL